jgi:hypothetical protein
MGEITEEQGPTEKITDHRREVSTEAGETQAPCLK